jgi:hypothetical protein
MRRGLPDRGTAQGSSGASARARRKYPGLKWVAAQLQDAYIRAGRTDEAAALAREQLAETRVAVAADSPQLAGVLANAGSVLARAKAWTEAEAVLREALAIREAKEPDAWTTFSTESLLGGAILGQR